MATSSQFEGPPSSDCHTRKPTDATHHQDALYLYRNSTTWCSMLLMPELNRGSLSSPFPRWTFDRLSIAFLESSILPSQRSAADSERCPVTNISSTFTINGHRYNYLNNEPPESQCVGWFRRERSKSPGDGPVAAGPPAELRRAGHFEHLAGMLSHFL